MVHWHANEPPVLLRSTLNMSSQMFQVLLVHDSRARRLVVIGKEKRQQQRSFSQIPPDWHWFS